MPEPTTESVRDAARLLDRMASLEGAVDRLTSRMQELAARLSPVEERMAAEAREREVAAAVRERLQAAGIETDDPVTGIRPTPSHGWVRAVTDGAATTGGGRIILGVVASILAIVAPEVLSIVAPMVGMQLPDTVEAVDVSETLPDVGPMEVPDTGPRLYTPAAPRPSL